MPRVTITRSWPDGDQIRISVQADDNHPDGLLGESARVAVKTYADTLDLTMAEELADGDPEPGDGR